MIEFELNGHLASSSVPTDTPLLWVIRDEMKLTGTKFGCGIGMCGACTVHVNGRAQRSCITPISAIGGAEITTIEGLNSAGQHPLQKAWVAAQTPQCGYCQSGQIMQAATLLQDFPAPTDTQISDVMNGSLCRCMAYVRVRRAIKLAAAEINGSASAHGTAK
jgi:isoquinoline 1-oxidoreductase subunit alpha